MLALIIMHVQCFLCGTSVAGARRKYGVKYPDMGSGIYARKLNDKDWESFNNYQRVHGNYLEDISLMSCISLVAGAFNPQWTSGLLVAYIVGRFFYGWGYIRSGASGRLAGVIILDLAKFAILGIAGYHAVKVAAIL